MDFFNILIQLCLDCNSFTNSECTILGGFNVDYHHVNNKTNQLCASLKYYMFTFDLAQLIKILTRFTCTTSIILDVILVSDPFEIMKSGVLDLDVSDHQLIYCTRKCKKSPVNQHNGVKLRSLKNYTKEAFEAKLQEVDRQDALAIDSVHEAFYPFKCNVLAVIDSAPSRYVRVKQHPPPG